MAVEGKKKAAEGHNEEEFNTLADELQDILTSSQLKGPGNYRECDDFIKKAPEKYRQRLHEEFCYMMALEFTVGALSYPDNKGLQQIRGMTAYAKFKSEMKYLNDERTRLPLLRAVDDLIQGKKDRIWGNVSAWVLYEHSMLLEEGEIFTCDFFTSLLVQLLKEGYPGMWTAIGTLLRRDGVEKGLPEMCDALEQVYYSDNNETTVDALAKVIQINDDIYLAKELLAYTYYDMKMWGNAASWFEQLEDVDPPAIRIFFEDIELFCMGWCYGKLKDLSHEEEYYRKALKRFSGCENALNNLGYSLYKQKRYEEAKEIFEDCIRQNRDMPYAANNYVRTLIALGDVDGAKHFAANTKIHISKSILCRLDKPIFRAKESVEDDDPDTEDTLRKVDVGAKKHQFSSEKILEDELVQRMEMGIPVFGLPLRIVRERSVYGRQYVFENGRIDILATDDKGNLYIIELKKDSGYDDAYQQVRDYIVWFEKHKAKKGQNVYGIICLNAPTSRLKEKVRADNQVRLFEYQISYTEVT